MPREQINYPVPVPVDFVKDGETVVDVVLKVPDSVTVAHIGWNKDGQWAQIGLQVDKAHLLELLAIYEPNPDGTVFLWSEVLDRTALNKLVRCSRKARDDAYGRDE